MKARRHGRHQARHLGRAALSMVLCLIEHYLQNDHTSFKVFIVYFPAGKMFVGNAFSINTIVLETRHYLAVSGITDGLEGTGKIGRGKNNPLVVGCFLLCLTRF